MCKIRLNEVEEIVDNLRLFDDTLMSMVFDGNIPATELLLKIILNRDDIRVISVIGQKEIKSPEVGGRCVTLDIVLEDEEKKRYNVEVQRDSKGASEHRARYHSSMLDVRMLKEGQNFTELKDAYVIFITEKDYFKEGSPVYMINRYREGSQKQFNDGSHIVYVNGSYKGEDPVGKLMHDFKCENPDDMNYKELADGVRHFKKEEGRKNMCESVERYAEKKAKEAEERTKAEMAMTIEKYAEKKAKEAEEKAKEDAIKIVVQMDIEYGASKEKIISDLCEKCSLSKEEAEEKYEEYAV